MANGVLAEFLARIEHKIDLLLKERSAGRPRLEQVGSVIHSCPVCSQPVQYLIDPQNAVVIRKCGCSTGKIPIDLSKFAPPAATENKNGRDEDSIEEDGSDPRDQRGYRRR